MSDEGVRHGVSSEVSVEAQLCEATYAFSQLESSRGSWQFPCSAQAKPKLRTELFRHLVTRAEPLVPRVPPPIPRLLLLSHHRPPFSPPCAGRPGGSGSFLLLPFWRLPFGALPFGLPFGALPFWHCCLFGLPPPPAACSARPAGVALSISHLYPAPKHKWRHGNAGRKVIFYHWRYDCD